MQATSFAPQTPVKVTQGTHKGKKGTVGQGTGTGRNRGKIPVELGRSKEVRWINPDWVEVVNQVKIPVEWQKQCEFSLVTSSGVAILVKFKPGCEGEIVAHQFDFTGPISPTGFKSHFVLATESEKYRTPHDYAQAYGEAIVAQLESTTKSRKRSPQKQKVLTALQPATNENNPSISTTAAETSISFPNELESVNCAFVGVTPVPGIPEEDVPVLCSDADCLAPTYQKLQNEFNPTALPLVKDSGSNNPSNQEEATVYSVAGDGVMASKMVINEGDAPESGDERQATVGGTESNAIALPQNSSKPVDAMDSTLTPLISEPSGLNPVPEVTPVLTVEVLEPLTPEEEFERYRLELKVERAFYEAGSSLRQLRELRLYRSTHETFAFYCRDRFGFTHRHVNYLIAGSQVVENLQMGTISSQTEDVQTKMGTNSSQILPTSETQVRPLASLEPDKQRELWQQAVKAAGGKVPSARIVKGIVERLKEKDTTPPPIPYQVGDVVLIRGLGNPELRSSDGQWAIIMAVNEYSVTLAVDGKDIPVKPQFLEEVDPKYWADVKAVNERISQLQQCDLDPAEDAVLDVLRRRTCFTPKQMLLLERMEQD